MERIFTSERLAAIPCLLMAAAVAICRSDLHLYNGRILTMEKGDALGPLVA